jgi:hypothetical protein
MLTDRLWPTLGRPLPATLLRRLLRYGRADVGPWILRTEFRNCGRCARCATGARPHGPYVYAFHAGHRVYLGPAT